MMFTNMLTITGTNFKVLNSIVELVSILVVNSLAIGERSTKVLLHYVSVLENTLTANVDSIIAESCDTRLSLLQVDRGQFIRPTSVETTSVRLAHLPVVPLENVRAVLNPANLSCCHIPLSYHNG